MRQLHGAVRPAVTLLLVVVLCVMVFLERPIPEMFGTLVISTLAYWFGERSKGG